MHQWLFLALLLSLGSGDPGLQASLSTDTINDALGFAYQQLTGAHLSLGNYEYESWVDLMHVDMKLSDIEITSITLNSKLSLVALFEPNILQYTLQGLEVEGAAGYEIDMDLIKLTPGNATFSLASTNATVNVTLTAVNGKPQIAIGAKDYAFSLGDAVMKTQLPDAINDILNKEIREKASSIAAMIPELLGKYIPLANKYLATIPTVVQCPVEPLAVDASITAGPSVQGELLVVGFNGTVIANGKAIPANFSVSVVAGANLTEGIQAAITDSFVNSLLAPIWETINLEVTDLPAGLPVSLDTSSLSLILPQLANTYGTGRPVKLTVFSSSSDSITVSTNNITNIDAGESVIFWVYSRSNWQQALVLDINATISANVTVTNNVATIYVTRASLQSVEVVSTNVGQVNGSSLISLVNGLIGSALPANVREIIPLPASLGALIKADDFKVASGYVVLGVDLNL